MNDLTKSEKVVRCDTFICQDNAPRLGENDHHSNEEGYNHHGGRCMAACLSFSRTPNDLLSAIINCDYFRLKENWKEIKAAYGESHMREFYSPDYTKLQDRINFLIPARAGALQKLSKSAQENKRLKKKLAALGDVEAQNDLNPVIASLREQNQTMRRLLEAVGTETLCEVTECRRNQQGKCTANERKIDKLRKCESAVIEQGQWETQD